MGGVCKEKVLNSLKHKHNMGKQGILNAKLKSVDFAKHFRVIKGFREME